MPRASIFHTKASGFPDAFFFTIRRQGVGHARGTGFYPDFSGCGEGDPRVMESRL